MLCPSWNTPTFLAPKALHPWLTNTCSMTAQLMQRFPGFQVRVLHSHLESIHIDEAKIIGLASKQLAYTREVLLCSQSEPLIYAHSVTHPCWLKTHFSWLNRQGSRSLGTSLFTNPLIQRSPLVVAKIGIHHPLYRKIQTALSYQAPYLWARRSCFIYHGAPLLVTEVFLPNFVEKIQSR